MDKNAMIQMLMGLLIVILSGLFTWSLTRINALNDRDAETNTQLALIQQTLDSLTADTEQDKKQDETITKFWKITNFHKDRINELRMMDGLPIMSWPPLD